MEIGMLWFDDDPKRDLREKVKRAAAHYERKYGLKPNVCYVHPGMLGGNGQRRRLRADGVEIRAGRAIPPHHLWVGIDELTH